MIDVDSPHISSVPSDYEEQDIKTETQAERERLEEESREKAEEAKEKAAALKDKARHEKEHVKKQSKKAGRKVQENSDNPVVVGNAVAIAALGG